MLLDKYIPDLSQLPMFLIRLASEVSCYHSYSLLETQMELLSGNMGGREGLLPQCGPRDRV